MRPMDVPDRPRRRAVWGAMLAVLGGGAVAAPGRAAETPSPAARIRRWTAAASEPDAKAFDAVLAEYRGRGLDDTLRGALVSAVCDAPLSTTLVGRLRAWREKDATPRDAWLWYRSLLREYEEDPDAVRAAASAPRNAFVRAAAIRARAAWADPDALAEVPGALASVEGDATERALLVEAWAQVVAHQPGRVGTPPFDAAVNALLATFDDARLPSRTRLAVARALGRAFRTDRLSFDPRTWRSLLARVDLTADDGVRYATPSATFFDVEASGDRVVYVLDLSSSMTAELDPRAVDELRRLVPPAPRGSPSAGIAWEDVHTALEAAVEFTLLSIRQLPKDAWFAVSVFGNEARMLPSTPGLVRVTKDTVAAATRDLRALQRGKGLGATNLHGALRRSFLAVPGTREADPSKPADPVALLTGGPTTMFLLSDGAPTHDDWDRTVIVVEDRPWFASREGLCDDLERMNLLQGCEVHAVAFGMAADPLLQRIVRLGGGRCRSIAAGFAAAPPPPAPSRAAEERARRAREVDDRVRNALAALAAEGADRETTLGYLREKLREEKAPDVRVRLAAEVLARGDRSTLPVLFEALTRGDDAIAAVADAALADAARISFGWADGLATHERAALRRNWEWWWARPAAPEGDGGR